MRHQTPNQALRRTAAGHRGCNRRVSWAPSLIMRLFLLTPIACIASVVLMTSAQGATIFITHEPSLPIGALTNPYASVSLEGGDALVSITSINSLPLQLSLIEFLDDGSNRLMFAISATPLVGVYAPQFGFPGGSYASYSESFSFSSAQIAALGSGSVALFATYSDEPSQTNRFTSQPIPEPSVPMLFGAGALASALNRRRKRTSRAMQPLPAVLFR